MSNASKIAKATSTEITGGAGFTYEDTVVAYYLAALLREDRAALQEGIVKSVAIQQSGHDRPMDDLVVEFDEGGAVASLDLQIKTAVSVSSGNSAFQDVVTRALEARAAGKFGVGQDAFGFVAERVSVAGLQSLERLIEWAKASPDVSHFARRFQPGGTAARPEREMRDDLKSLIGAQSEEDEWYFYRQFVGARFDGLKEGGVLRMEVVNRLQELVESDEDGQSILLFDRLCRLVRDGAGTARKWTRVSLLAQLRGAVRLKVTPAYQADLDLITQFAADGVADIVDGIEGFRVERPSLQNDVGAKLKAHRVVNISGLPGCGKSVVLRRTAVEALSRGPILFIKSDRLSGKSWLEFAAKLGLRHRKVDELLAEIGATGSPVLYIDGIDRINPDQKRIILDILHAIEANKELVEWRVLATSRDQGLETYRAWFPSSFYKGSTIGDVQVKPFNDAEAEALAKEKPGLRHLLMGTPAVRDIARRPFFAGVLARSFGDDAGEPQTETDLINAWWARAGHDASPSEVPQRQRALLDLAERSISSLGKNFTARSLAPQTFDHITALKADLILRGRDGDASFSFTHDIFFEWVFFRLLIDLDADWVQGIAKAGEPPLLGRVVGLLAQHLLTTPGRWSAGYRALEGSTLRPQWRREWLTAPPFTSAFDAAKAEFEELLIADDFALLEKALVWFQAQHTVPSPIVLGQAGASGEGVDRIRLAELLSWPSDFVSWGRFLDWLILLAPRAPVRLMPIMVEVFSVWQNVFFGHGNPRSKSIVETCSQWLIDLEHVAYQDRVNLEHGKWEVLGRDALAQLATTLRIVIVRAAKSYPQFANNLFDRALANKRMRGAAYSDLMALARFMVEVSPERLAAVTKAEILEELPQDKVDRERARERERSERLRRIREKPENERTEGEKKALQHFHLPISSSGSIDDDIGIDRHHSYYYPVSALQEPFASLFSERPNVALQLVRDVANHATTGWRQVQKLSWRHRRTPIPINIDFPWGTQQFWGNWQVYSWHLGQLTAQPLECAFLALSYWAFRQIEAGQPVDEIIRLTVEGNHSVAAAGLALVLALETFEVSEVTLALVSAQRLWRYDIERARQEPMRNVDLFGFGSLSQLTGDQAKAKDFLDKRQSRSRNVQELAMRFATNGNASLRERFKAAVASFPVTLPYEFEEHRSDLGETAALAELAQEYSALAAPENYRRYRTPDNQVMLAYQPPLTDENLQRGEAAWAFFHQQSFLSWAIKSLREFVVAPDKTLTDAVALARPLYYPSLFAERLDVKDHTPQSLVAAVAACQVCFGEKSSDDYSWALSVLEEIESMREPAMFFGGSRINWHPVLQLIYALLHLRRSDSSNLDPARRILGLTAHPHEEAAELAFAALLADPSPQVAWSAAQLALDLSAYYRPTMTKGGMRESRAAQQAVQKARRRAEKALTDNKPKPFPTLPAAWKKHPGVAEWQEPNPLFDAQRAAKKVRKFPIEKWCELPDFKPLALELIQALVRWTSERLNPARTDRQRDRTNVLQWNDALGDLLARAAPYFDVAVVKSEFLSPFLTGDDALDVIAEFADKMVRRHILDSHRIPSGTFELLDVCVGRAIEDTTFLPGAYRAGEVSGHHLPKLVDALLIVAVERANGAARFVNGDWSEIELVMPMVTRLVTTAGWSTYVMSKFLLLCERAGDGYPVDAFVVQVTSVLANIANAKGNWVGTNLAARTAATVQRLADANYPLRTEQAQGLLRILDALIDLGDRRSAALELTEAFRGVQVA
ncbi:hypothetical protein GO283_00587 [Ralstonia solanacearum]|nr:hypothetical protein [Ralstonia solanacearum]